MSYSLQSNSYRTIDTQTAATSLLLKSTLTTLQELYNLNSEDIGETFKILCVSMDINTFATFIAITNQCLSIGSYSLLYNKNLAEAIRNHNFDRVVYMAKRGKLEVPEIYGNDRLSKSDIEVIDELLSIDIDSIIFYIMNYNPDLDLETYTVGRVEITSEDSDFYSYSESTGQTGNKFLQKCRNMVCYKKGRMHLPIGQEDKVYTSIQEQGRVMSTITCLDIRKAFYLAASSPQFLNPDFLESLKRTHRKEISIYQYAISRGYVLPPAIM